MRIFTFLFFKVGENGAGKTTLLKILQGDLSPVSGICHLHRNLTIGYFSQHHVDQLEMNQTSLEMMAERFPGRLNSGLKGLVWADNLSGIYIYMVKPV
jgi:ATP-binding cassette subfamily F protein 3